MIWHIFRKDLLLLWPLALSSGVAQLALDAMMFVTDSGSEAPYLLLVARLFAMLVFLVIAFTVALVVQQDAIPGTRQDWLVRPIRRVDLLLAKALFVLVAVHLPMFAGDLAEGLAHGFGLADAGRAALSRDLYVMLGVTLPVFALAAMTRTLTQFVVAGVIYFFALTAASFLLGAVARIHGEEQATNPLAWTGIAWVPQALARLALTLGGAIALGLLYARRRVAAARIGFALLAVVSAFATLLPWSWLFAIQAAATGTPASAPELGVAIDAHAPHYIPAPGENVADYAAGAAQVQLRGRAAGDIQVENQTRQALGARTIFVPVRFTGLPAGVLPWADRADVTLSAGGTPLFTGHGDDLRLGQGGLAYEAIRLPALAFEAARDRPVTIAIDYSLSLLRPSVHVDVPALGADMLLPRTGHCTSGRDSDGDDIALRCVRPGKPPSCVVATLVDPATGRRNPQTQLCAPDYSPYAGRLLPDAISRFEVEVPFRDRLGLAHYPVGPDQLGRARIVLTSYVASQHLVRRVVASGARLSDWTTR